MEATPAQLSGRPAPILALEPTLATVTRDTTGLDRPARPSTTAQEWKEERTTAPQEELQPAPQQALGPTAALA